MIVALCNQNMTFSIYADVRYVTSDQNLTKDELLTKLI